MLTIGKIDEKKAKSYFLKNYYLQETSRWSGKGSLRWGLSGPITNEEAFKNLCEGYSPGRRKKLYSKTVKHGQKRRAAIDCTFNAPKSVTLSALVGGDERLIEAHHTAVAKTLELIEERYSHTRIRRPNGEREVVTTGNLIIAQFDHIDARKVDEHYKGDDQDLDEFRGRSSEVGGQKKKSPSQNSKITPNTAAKHYYLALLTPNSVSQATPDPHLHTHCLIMNATEVSKGKWYSHLNDAIFQNQKLLGMTYQHYLAMEVQKLGYEVEARDHGQFDIKGYDHDALMEFSKRRRKILELAGNDSSRERLEAVREVSRAHKGKINPEELKVLWFQEAKKLGIKIVKPKSQSVPNRYRESSLSDAISHCSERAVAFKQEDLEKFILNERIPTDIRAITPQIQQNSELIKVTEPNRVRYTTQTALKREIATIRLMQQGRGTVSPIANFDAVNQYLEGQSLTTGQLDAVHLALTTNDQFLAWQGVASAGKTYALAKFTDMALKNGYSVKGFAPSADAAKVLGSEIGINGATVASLLHSKSNQTIEPNLREFRGRRSEVGDDKKRSPIANSKTTPNTEPLTPNSPNQIWIVDEAGLLSAKDAYDLMLRAKKEQARVIFVGDTRQLSAVEAGNPFKSLQQAGMATASMNQSLRQRTPHLQVAVDLIAQGEVKKGFKRLEENDCICEVDEDEKVQRIVSDYLAIDPEKRDKTLVLAGTNRERLQITQGIRDGLKKEGKLGKTAMLTQLKRKDLTNVQMKYAHNFKVGDVIMPTKEYKRRGLEKGQYYEITGKKDDLVILRNNQGQSVTVDLGFEKAAFITSEIEIAEGDTLKWTKNDRQLGRRNGQTFEVISINENTATIKFSDGTTKDFDVNTPQFLDYAIVSTTYSAQGKTADNVLISADFTVGKESFYVAVSRVKYDLKLYTENKEDLVCKAMESKAKENPLELLKNMVSERQLATITPNLGKTNNKSVHQGNQTNSKTHTNSQLNQSSIQQRSYSTPNSSGVHNHVPLVRVQDLNHGEQEKISPTPLDNPTTFIVQPPPPRLSEYESGNNNNNNLENNISTPKLPYYPQKNFKTTSLDERSLSYPPVVSDCADSTQNTSEQPYITPVETSTQPDKLKLFKRQLRQTYLEVKQQVEATTSDRGSEPRKAGGRGQEAGGFFFIPSPSGYKQGVESAVARQTLRTPPRLLRRKGFGGSTSSLQTRNLLPSAFQLLPPFDNNYDEYQIDLQIAHMLFEQMGNYHKVAAFLAHSDTSYHWKDTLDQDEYLEKITKYANQILEQVYKSQVKISQKSRHNSQFSRKQDDLELG